MKRKQKPAVDRRLKPITGADSRVKKDVKSGITEAKTDAIARITETLSQLPPAQAAAVAKETVAAIGKVRSSG